MNRKLTDGQITALARALLAKDPAMSGRALRAALKRRHGSAGKTDRVFAIWRTLRADALRETGGEGTVVEGLKRQVTELEDRIREAERSRDEALKRAQLAEAREIGHQDRWAKEIDDLRHQVRDLEGHARRTAELESRVLDLTGEVVRLTNRKVPGSP